MQFILDSFLALKNVKISVTNWKYDYWLNF